MIIKEVVIGPKKIQLGTLRLDYLCIVQKHSRTIYCSPTGERTFYQADLMFAKECQRAQQEIEFLGSLPGSAGVEYF